MVAALGTQLAVAGSLQDALEEERGAVRALQVREACDCLVWMFFFLCGKGLHGITLRITACYRDAVSAWNHTEGRGM